MLRMVPLPVPGRILGAALQRAGLAARTPHPALPHKGGGAI
jgi:hypothetical protein